MIKMLRDNQGLELSIWLLKITGLWPPSPDGKKTLFDRLREVVIVVFGLALGGVVCIVLYPIGGVTSRHNLSELLECIGIGFLDLMSMIKIGCFFLRVERVKMLTSRIELSRQRDMADNLNEGKKTIGGEIQRRINFFVVVAFGCILVLDSCVFFRLPTMIANRKHFARIWFPIDQYVSPTYEILCSLWTIRALICFSAVAAADGFSAGMLVQIIGQFRLLRHDFSRIRENAVELVRRRHEQQELQEETPSRDRGWKLVAAKILNLNTPDLDREVEKEMELCLGTCVVRYQDCARFVQDFESVFGPLMLIELSVVAPFLAAIFFADLKLSESDEAMDAVARENLRVEHLQAMLMYVMVILVLCMELATLCYLTNMITSESDQVRDAVFSCDWFSSSESFKRSMRIVMSRSNQPLYVRVAGFVPLTQETLLKIMHLAYTNYTAMYTVVHGSSKKHG